MLLLIALPGVTSAATCVALEADPEVMAEQLLEGEPIDKQAPGVFRGGARLAMQQLGRALTMSGDKPDVDQVVGLLRSGKWQDLVRTRLGKSYVSGRTSW